MWLALWLKAVLGPKNTLERGALSSARPWLPEEVVTSPCACLPAQAQRWCPGMLQGEVAREG